MAGSQQENEVSPLVSGHRRRGRIAIKVGLGFFWLLGIAVGLSTLFVLVVLATQNPLTLGLMAGAGAAGVGLPSIFLSFPHVRAWFVDSLERAAKWFLPDPKPVVKPSAQNADDTHVETPASLASSSPEPDGKLSKHSKPSINGDELIDENKPKSTAVSASLSPISSHHSQATEDDVSNSVFDDDDEEATARDDERGYGDEVDHVPAFLPSDSRSVFTSMSPDTTTASTRVLTRRSSTNSLG
jgi:hypothetical protein